MRWKGPVLFLVFIFISACHPRISPDLDSPAGNAERLLSKLYARNSALETFKGIGQIRIWNATGSQSARIAWIGELDGRLRVEILGPTGRPLMKMAYDGKFFYFGSTEGRGIKKNKIRNPNLGHFLDVPVTIRELTFFLTGRFPVYEYRTVELVEADPSTAAHLVLRRFWTGVVEKIGLTPGHAAVQWVRVYDRHGLSYRAGLFDYRQHGDFFIPEKITITNGGAAGFEIRIDRYWPNIDVSEDQFVVSPA